MVGSADTGAYASFQMADKSKANASKAGAPPAAGARTPGAEAGSSSSPKSLGEILSSIMPSCCLSAASQKGVKQMLLEFLPMYRHSRTIIEVTLEGLPQSCLQAYVFFQLYNSPQAAMIGRRLQDLDVGVIADLFVAMGWGKANEAESNGVSIDVR